MEENLIKAVSKGDLVALKKHYDPSRTEKKVAEDLLVGATIGNFKDIVSFLLDNGVSPDAKDKKGKWSALHYAADNCRLEIAEELIRKGANVNVTDDFGNIPLQKAIFKRKACPELMKLLVKKGSDIDHKNNHGVSARDLAEGFDVDLEAL